MKLNPDFFDIAKFPSNTKLPSLLFPGSLILVFFSPRGPFFCGCQLGQDVRQRSTISRPSDAMLDWDKTFPGKAFGDMLLATTDLMY